MLTLKQVIINEIISKPCTRPELYRRVVDDYRIAKKGSSVSASEAQNAVYKLQVSGVITEIDEQLTIADLAAAEIICSKPASKYNYSMSRFDPRLLSLPWPAPILPPRPKKRCYDHLMR